MFAVCTRYVRSGIFKGFIMGDKNGNSLFVPRIIFWSSFLIAFTGLYIIATNLGFKLPGIRFGPEDREPYNDVFDYANFTETTIRQNDEGLSKTTTAATMTMTTTKTAATTTGNPSTKLRLSGRNITTHIAFLKVHKAGSTTMQNLFFRFGIKHKLNILLPQRGNYLYVKEQQVPINPKYHYDIFACHTVYSKALFDSLLPADSVKIGIVREPFERMISAAYYYRDVWGVDYLKEVPEDNFIHNLVQYPEKYERQLFTLTRNSMGKDFGFPGHINIFENGTIRHLLDKLNSEFLLVMTTERFDESLALMRRFLGWSFVDILYYQTNSHKHSPVILNETEQAKFKETSFLDFHIYEYFAEELDSKIRKQDSDFPKEVEFFKSALQKVSSFCSEDSKFTETTLFIERTEWDNSFNVTKSDCLWMKIDELAFIKILRETQKLSE